MSSFILYLCCALAPSPPIKYPNNFSKLLMLWNQYYWVKHKVLITIKSYHANSCSELERTFLMAKGAKSSYPYLRKYSHCDEQIRSAGQTQRYLAKRNCFQTSTSHETAHLSSSTTSSVQDMRSAAYFWTNTVAIIKSTIYFQISVRCSVCVVYHYRRNKIKFSVTYL